MKITICLILYFGLFCVFEYLNNTQMTSGSWASLTRFALRPEMLVFFALSPILVWGLNKEIYEFVGQRFWFMGAVMGFLEFAAYLIAGFLFCRKAPTLREGIAFALIVIALLIANEKQ